MLTRGKLERGVVEMVDMESLAPPDHLLRKIDAAVDFGKLYEPVEPLYSEEEGRYSIDPVALFKIVLLQHLDGIASLRGTLRRAQTDMAYRWFLGNTLSEELPPFSTVSCNFRHRFTEETIERVFADAKEKHAMRYTLYRGLAQVTKWVRLKFAAKNLKKLANWKSRRPAAPFRSPHPRAFPIIYFAACLDPFQTGRFSTD